MTSRIPFYLSVGLLIAAGIALSVIRHETYGVPWTPGETRQVWDIEARVEFNAIGKPAKVSLAAPYTQEGFTLIGESASSPGYGVSYVDSDAGRRAEWSIRQAQGPQTIYYKTQFLVDDQALANSTPPTEEIIKPTFDGPEEAAAIALVERATSRSSDNITFTRELIKALNDGDSQNSALILNSMTKLQAASKLLAYADVPSKVVGVIELEDGRRRQSSQQMLQVWDGKKWQIFSPETTEGKKQQNLLVWDESNVSLLDVVGGKDSKVHFTMISQEVSPQEATNSKVDADGLLNFSIHSLPLEEQAMFKTIMLIPIGALIVVFLRILIGLKTSGTFMPVLIAVAFVQTQLVTGIVGFLLIVGTGLVIRSYLSKLNLLLVARISAVIITVILIISVFTVVAFKIGLTEGLSITFFPMIILSWTIERMSILWEEEGAKEVVLQGGGSLLTAVLVYLAMTNPYVQHLTFNFIGLQLVILGGILMLGTYTGYRLTELRRFKPLTED
ncbi:MULTISPECIES: inactive transglutaminase family protein [Vibrio]|uniref:Gonadoliberin III n=1 Tax=Vibrio mediterranei TaxID=689 RepID=A0A2S9ZUD8_9VIBR|nr:MULTISPECIES: inactive transglutaminase family protein [Vibrio]AYV22465.1 gonadoliberin III [Vibrio mediterranei]EDL51339.1 Gonadoliberin III-related protein [Vibrio mediterranei AK1]MCF4174575.1 inactive transglutaminase family protein [Vibrio sp. McD22-P3]MCG9666273.1 inactive transglutaminase family protein [Vibrio mediterranei]MDA0108221.1 inactive transglutaminase family protein [Vibrio sp. La 4.2.2]